MMYASQLWPILLLGSAAGASVRGASSVSSLAKGDTSRNLMEGLNATGPTSFQPLPCNTLMSDCVLWSSKNYEPSMGPIVIPCGQCITMDLSGNLALPNGLEVDGKLVIPDGTLLKITTPYIVVQGELEMTSTRPTSSDPDVKIILTGQNNIMFVPHDEQTTTSCKGGAFGNACNLGTKPIAVVGGKLNVKGLPDNCTSWTTLKNIEFQGPASPQATVYQPSRPGCSDVLMDYNFEGSGIKWPEDWYRNYAGTDNYEVETGGNHYALFGGRTSTWNGPQNDFDAKCIVPNVPYFVSARARLTKQGGTSSCATSGTNCLKLTLFTQDSDIGNRWQNKGTSGRHNDGEWFDFVAVTSFDQKTANSTTATARRLFWEGPEAGVDIALDNIKIFRAPESAFATSCSELLLNGDAEDTFFHPFTYPVAKTEGPSILTIESEGDIFGGTNHYYALRNRHASWSSASYDLPLGCGYEHAVYSVSVDLRVHSATPKNFRFQLTVTQPNGSKTYPWLFSCSSQDINDGWKTCSGTFAFTKTEATASQIKLYLVTDDAITEDVDYDNFSMAFKSGPASSLILSDPNGGILSCWGSGSKLLVTSNNLKFDDVSTPTIKNVTDNGDNTVTVTLNEEIPSTSFEDSAIDFGVGVEVALLSRNILVQSADPGLSDGGHLIIYQTAQKQQLDGVKFVKMGQQGNLGRYPVHFHMCGSTDSSVVSRNVVEESNQRCFVIHGTHNVTLESNVAYNTSGHCFMLEDFAEMDNSIHFNLAAVTRKVTKLIRAEETDNKPSSFWITNPKNSFVGNVAAGSEESGFWFEMATAVRGPSFQFYQDMQPNTMALTLFKDNVAHSNAEHGIKTYPGQGYKPKGAQAQFIDSKSYRNKGDGVFIHNSLNIRIQGGVFADNRKNIDIDRSPSCTVDGANIVGYSDDFRLVVSSSDAWGLCPSGWPLVGVDIHTYWAGGSVNTGTEIINTVFTKFGDTGCANSSAIRVDTENKGYFDIRTTVSYLSFDSASLPISACDAVHAGVDNFALHDQDGSLMGEIGFLVADTARMTTFGNCIPDSSTCTARCANQCFRAMALAVDNFEDSDLGLEIKDTNTQTTLTISGYTDEPIDMTTGAVSVDEHTKIWRSRMFFPVLPSGGSYSVRFVKNGQTHWPTYVKSNYDDPGTFCPPFNQFELVVPNDESCNELITNGNMDLGIAGWHATQGGVAVVDETSSGQGPALTSLYRSAYWMAPAQFLDTRCMITNTVYKVSAKVKLAKFCDSTKGECPKINLKIQSGADEAYGEQWFNVGLFPSTMTWNANDWNVLTGTLFVTQAIADAQSVYIYFESQIVDALMVIDDVTITPI